MNWNDKRLHNTFVPDDHIVYIVLVSIKRVSLLAGLEVVHVSPPVATRRVHPAASCVMRQRVHLRRLPEQSSYQLSYVCEETYPLVISKFLFMMMNDLRLSHIFFGLKWREKCRIIHLLRNWLGRNLEKWSKQLEHFSL